MDSSKEVLVRVEPYSIEEGQSARIIITDNFNNAKQIEWYVSVVDTYFNEFRMSSSGTPLFKKGALSIICPSIGDLKPGLYFVAQLILRDENGNEIATLKRKDYGPALFEIRKQNQKAKNDEELLSKFENILKFRTLEFEQGIGEGRDKFQCCIFFKNCLIASKISLGYCSVIPFDGLSCTDEISLIQKFCKEYGFMPPTNVEDAIKRSRSGHPTAVIYFPVVHGASHEQAGITAQHEADRLIALLSLYRRGAGSGGAGSIIGSIVKDNQTGAEYFSLNLPTYTGNMIAGFLSDESPRIIYNQIKNLRLSEFGILYVNLFREALREPDVELKFFRFWNILELIARNKEYVGREKCDWQGNILKNRKGRLMKIQNHAEELVFELLREALPSKGYTKEKYSTNLEFSEYNQLISIWYRRRNCVTHGGHCLCRNPSLQIVDAKYLKCKKARDEEKGSAFGYLFTLQEVTKDVIDFVLNE